MSIKRISVTNPHGDTIQVPEHWLEHPRLGKGLTPLHTPAPAEVVAKPAGAVKKEGKNA